MKKVLLSFCTLFLIYSAQSQQASQYFYSPYVEHYANVIPKTPNASNFRVYGNTSVDFSSGVPSITIPIYTLVEDGVQIPISISYDASGVKVGDLASVVGLKWRLNAGGGIFRSINGGAADENGWITTGDFSYIESSWYSNHSINLKSTQDWLKHSDRDHDPDRFNYSFPGGSGAFVFRPKTGANALSIIKERADQVTILPSSDFNSFQAKDFKGNVFDFGVKKEWNENTSTNTSQSVGNLNFSGSNTMANKVTGWMLDRVSTKNNKTINFDYSRYDLTYQINTISQRWSKGALDCTQYNANNPAPLNRYTKESTSIIYKPKNQLISTIESDNVKVNFIYSDVSDASDWKKKLVKIIIEDKIENKQKAFHFVYETFNGDPRLKLKEVYEVAFHFPALAHLADRKPSYIFTYDETKSLPQKSSMSKDYWGYFNGKSNASLIPNNTLSYAQLVPYRNELADRNVDTDFAKAGVIEKIQYPTGGSTEFLFESNQTTGLTPEKQGGLRVKEIKDLDGEGNTYNHTFYTYDDFNGIEWDVSNTHKQFPGAHTFSSDFISTDLTLNKQGHFYGKVTVKQKKGTVEFLKSEYLFENNSTLSSFSSLPKETLLYNGTLVIQKKEFFYTKSILETIYWNQLGDRDICYDDFYTGIGTSMAVGYNTPNKMYYHSYKHLLETEVTTNYNKDIQTQSGIFELALFKPQTLVRYYQYNSDLLVTQVRTSGLYNGGDPMRVNHPSYSEDYDANGEYFLIDTTYPSNYPNDASLQNLVTTKNLKAIPISKIVTNKGEQIQGQYFTYNNYGNIKESYKYNKGQGSNTSNVSYIPSNYDLFANYTSINGKPTQIQREDGTYISYVWDSSDTYVMAKIVNATHSEAIAQFSGSIDLSSNDSTIEDKLNSIRNGLTNAQVTTFMYNPLIGVKSVTDSRGETINYHYDSFGRLETVKDAQGKIVSQTKYHYKN